MEQKLELTQEWDKVFPLSEKVNHKKVTFETQYGLTLAADLYTPASPDPSKERGEKLPAIAVSGPFGAVKEQCSGLYAMRMAERGFVALAFDPSYTGESSGEPRRTASPDINTEDFMAAVDYLSQLENVDAEKIGIIGICGWGGIALNAAAADTRIKATVASATAIMMPTTTSLTVMPHARHFPNSAFQIRRKWQVESSTHCLMMRHNLLRTTMIIIKQKEAIMHAAATPTMAGVSSAPRPTPIAASYIISTRFALPSS